MIAKDLSKEPPRSPHVRIHDYVILARTIDKCRASLNNTLGDYHFNCPLDRMLFAFKDIRAEDFLALVESGASDDEIAKWLDRNGSVQTPGSISNWSRGLDAYQPYDNPDKRDWIIEQCEPLGLNPKSTTLFGFLDADDQASFPGHKALAHDSNNWDLPMVDTSPRSQGSSIKATPH